VTEEEEGFLNRWSRRKQEAAQEVAEEPGKIAEQTAAPEQSDATQTPEEEFDVSKLPPVESITAGTDIRQFLSKGVPAALTQAALRRAWSADPAIRDYIGLSEYSWDFNAPGQFGFGELDPSLNIQEMVADMYGQVKKVAAEAEEVIEKADSSLQTEQGAEQTEPMQSVKLDSGRNDAESESRPAISSTEAQAGDKTAQYSAAPQQQVEQEETFSAPMRRHGSALPS
jgi:hypothetical protein